MSPTLMDSLRLLPDLLAQHLLLSLSALAIGIGISLPLGLICARSRSLAGPILGVASAIQTIPSLALLALMVPLLGMIGFVPALIALVLYSALPVLRNTVVGIQSVPTPLIEAARGVGMTRFQSLVMVELPHAAPMLLAGIRTATVWVVGIATLATPVGQATLGNFIFTGLQTQNHASVVLGCVAAAGLALVLDTLLHVAEVAVRIRSQRRLLASALALTMVTLGGLSPLIVTGPVFDSRPSIVVGAKTFTEQHVMAEILAERLRATGFRPSTKAGMGSQLLFDALAQGSVDCYVDYTGTIWTNVMGRSDFPGRRQMMVEIKRFLSGHKNILVAGRLGFENTYALAMRRDRAAALGIKSISDLESHAPNLRIGGDVEFFGRPEFAAMTKLYNLAFKQVVSMDSSIMYAACAEGEIDLVAAFSSDGRIAAFDLLVLRDDREVFPPYDAIVLLSRKAASRPEVVAAVNTLVNSIDDELMRRTNRLVDVDGQSPRDAAKYLLTSLEEQAEPAATEDVVPIGR